MKKKLLQSATDKVERHGEVKAKIVGAENDEKELFDLILQVSTRKGKFFIDREELRGMPEDVFLRRLKEEAHYVWANKKKDKQE